MEEKKRHQSDRQTGAALDQETVERLRRGMVWMQKNRGLRLKDVAIGCDVAEHTVRNFAYGKAARPDNTFLGRLFRYLAGFREVIPSEFAWNSEGSAGRDVRRHSARPLHYDLVRSEVQLDEKDLLRVYERYSGYYLCFSRAPRTNHMVVSWLHVRAFNPAVRATRGELLMPRFTLFSRYPDRFDANRSDEYIAAGYVTTRHGNVFLTGQQDGELRYMILKEPAVRKFTYLGGLCLSTSIEDREPYSARVVCQSLGPRVSRAAWQDRVGLFDEGDFRLCFSNANVIERVLGAGNLLRSEDPR
jgi:hypothetical protein